MNQTTENFIEVFENLTPWEPPRVFFRLYYDANGCPITYTMDDLPGDYIEIDAQTYALQPRDVKIVNGKLIFVNTKTSQKLTPSNIGTPCHVHDVCVVVPKQLPNTKWNLTNYDSN